MKFVVSDRGSTIVLESVHKDLPKDYQKAVGICVKAVLHTLQGVDSSLSWSEFNEMLRQVNLQLIEIVKKEMEKESK